MIFNIIMKEWRHLLAATLAVVGVIMPRVASANPRPLPFTYPYETLADGALEVELYADTTPLRVAADPADASRGRLWEPYYMLQTELEYGLSDRWELGLYQVFEASPTSGGGNNMTFDGMKARIRTRLAEAGEWPVDVGLYLEVASLHDELELEEKILLSRRFGRLRVMSNLWVEQELRRPYDSPDQRELALVINPTLGATWQLSPRFQVGAEYWARGKIAGRSDPDTSGMDAEAAEAARIEKRNDAIHHFIGPTFHANFGRMWLSTGLYFHGNDMNKPQPGEAYGPVWMRTVIGLDL
jgi:hypothetical protein